MKLRLPYFGGSKMDVSGYANSTRPTKRNPIKRSTNQRTRDINRNKRITNKQTRNRTARHKVITKKRYDFEPIVYSQCNVRATFNNWEKQGGALLNIKTIGCGINALTFLGLMSRDKGNAMVQKLVNDPTTVGTSYAEISQIVNFNMRNNYTILNEVITNIADREHVQDLLLWILNYSENNACMIVKLNRDRIGSETGHTLIISKLEDDLWIVDPQTVVMYKINTDGFNKIVRFIERNNFITASIMVRIKTELETQISRFVYIDYISQLSLHDTTGLFVVVKANPTQTVQRKLQMPRLLYFPISDMQIEKWNDFKCSLDTRVACTEHVLGFLKILPKYQYDAMVWFQQQTQAGTLLDKTTRIITEAQFKQNDQYSTFGFVFNDINTDQSIENYVFRHIPNNNGTMVCLNNKDVQMGHMVIFAKNNKGMPIIIDFDQANNVGIKFYNGFDEINEYMSNFTSLIAVPFELYPVEFTMQ